MLLFCCSDVDGRSSVLDFSWVTVTLPNEGVDILRGILVLELLLMLMKLLCEEFIILYEHPAAKSSGRSVQY